MPPRPYDVHDDSRHPPVSSVAPSLGSSPSSGTPSALSPGRTKPVASLSSGKNTSQPDIPRHEIQLPKNPQINGQPLEAYLYKDVGECPICFLYYPPYLNRTRCCDQAICSECFVQIKRPDPHPPEHTDPNSPPPENIQLRPLEAEGQLVSEPGTCPFCKMPEFGITYDPPPFRRGLAYVNDPVPQTGRANSSAASRRPRGQSMSASHPEVITTDTVRPDWAAKLHEARRQQDRRSRAATALHQAAYHDSGSGPFNLDRFRRVLNADRGEGNSSASSARAEQWNQAQWEQAMAMWNAQDSSRGQRRGHQDLLPSRVSSRDTRVEDVEELMLRRAIQESIAAEEERRRKEEKEAEKERKKEEKKRAKEQKKAGKAARKNASGYPGSANNSDFFAGGGPPEQSPSPVEGKGKARVSSSEEGRQRASSSGYQPGGFNPLDEPTSTLNSEPAATKQRHDTAQRHLEQSCSNLSSDFLGTSPQQTTDSFMAESAGPQSSALDSHPSTHPSDPPLPLSAPSDDQSGNGLSLNFSSLAEMIDADHASGEFSERTEDATPAAAQRAEGRSRGASSASQSEPPRYHLGGRPDHGHGPDGHDSVDTKHGGNVAVVGRPEST